MAQDNKPIYEETTQERYEFLKNHYTPETEVELQVTGDKYFAKGSSTHEDNQAKAAVHKHTITLTGKIDRIYQDNQFSNTHGKSGDYILELTSKTGNKHFVSIEDLDHIFPNPEQKKSVIWSSLNPRTELLLDRIIEWSNKD